MGLSLGSGIRGEMDGVDDVHTCDAVQFSQLTCLA